MSTFFSLHRCAGECLQQWPSETGLRQSLKPICISIFTWKITTFSSGDRDGERSRGQSVIPAIVAVDEIRAAQATAILVKSREESAQRLMMAYAITGLFFMLLLGMFLGVWNLISISGGHGSAISKAWIQAHGHAQIFGWSIFA
jgi:hypothetical protein